MGEGISPLCYNPKYERDTRRQSHYSDDFGRLRISGTRVLLDVVIYAYHQGKTSEQIVQMYPSLNLDNLYLALAHYFLNRIEIETYLRRMEAEAEYLHQAWEAQAPPNLTRSDLVSRLEF